MVTTQATTENYVLGTLRSVLFESADSYFKILLIEPQDVSFDWETPEIVVTGTFADVTLGAIYAFYGQLTRHPKYGEQLKATRYENELPADEGGLVQYFASDQFPGIGKKTAEKIVEALGLDAVELILSDADVLVQVGLKATTASKIQATLQRNLGLERLFQITHQLGISAETAGRLYETFGADAQTILEKTPYRLVFDFDGVTFKKADEIGRSLGISATDSARVQAGVYATAMNLTFAGGHTFVLSAQLIEAVSRVLQIRETSVLQDAISDLVARELFVLDGERLYPRNLYDAEVSVGADLQRLLKADKRAFAGEYVAQVLAKSRLTLDDTQIDAVNQALASGVFVLTGGPGTGKTTIIKTMVNAWQKQLDAEIGHGDQTKAELRQRRVLLASPTGRAAKRMTEVTGFSATTIHRLLGIVDLQVPEFDAETPLEGGLLIVDEASMLDIELTAKLLAAVPDAMRVIFVGDAQQLPSVGPGNVLADLLASEVPQAKLNRVYRQDESSTISVLAQHLQAGQLPADFTAKQPDRNTFLVSVDAIPATIEQIVKVATKRDYTAADVQILTPMYRTAAGVETLNPLLQDIFNPAKKNAKTLSYGQTTYRVGDKVLQLENDSEKDIYNGDMGVITAIQAKTDPLNTDNEDRLVVDFDGNHVNFPKKDLHQLTLAYATTVHKAQGSEFPVVIVVLTNQMVPMLNRNLLYTAITRAKKSLILVGDYRAFERAAQQAVPPRQTALVQRLTGAVTTKITTTKKAPPKPIKPELTTLIDLDAIDPLIGMDNQTPYDFM